MMKAKFNGIEVEVEGTPYELAEFKRLTDHQNYKITYPQYPNPYWEIQKTSPTIYPIKLTDMTCWDQQKNVTSITASQRDYKMWNGIQ